MKEDQFYRSYNLQKYPDDGLLNYCKKCLTLQVDNWDSKTFLWILQEVDVPWIPEEWDKLMMKYAGDPTKVTSTTIIGRYIGKMRLKQYKDYRWKDTDFLAKMAEKKVRDTMERQGYSAAEIAESIETVKAKSADVAPAPDIEAIPEPEYPTNPKDYFASPEDDANLDLTEEDTRYLRLKWGNTYKPSEWVQLEQFYQEMMDSYDIQTAAHKDTLKLICKTSLKANQLLDLGDKTPYLCPL